MTPEQMLEMIRLYNEDNISLKKIGKIFKADETTISRLLKEAGIVIKRRKTESKRHLEIKKILNDNKDTILKMYLEENKTVADIGRFLNLNQAAVWRYLKSQNIQIRKVQWNQYDIDESYFEIINSHEKAYWLGWLFSDGFMIERLGRVGLRIHPKDIEILEKFKECLKTDAPIHIYTSNREPNPERRFKGGKQIISQFVFSNNKICQDLKKTGMTDRKSLTLNFPNIDKQYYYSFLRGYIDGDGCLCMSKSWKNQYKFTVSMISSRFFVNFVHKFLTEEGFNVAVHQAHDCKATYVVSISNKIQCLRFLEKIYENDLNYFRLTRKYNKYLAMKEFVSKNPVNQKHVTSKPLPNRYI